MKANFETLGRRERKTKTRGASGQHKKEGEEFLTNNRRKPDVKETNSGLQYIVVEEGTGNVPNEFSTVEMHHRILLLNGTVLADTYKSNTPVIEPFRELIEGVKEGLQFMKEGGRYKFWVPADLAWGRKGTTNKIPPNAVLFFDIRLIKVS